MRSLKQNAAIGQIFEIYYTTGLVNNVVSAVRRSDVGVNDKVRFGVICLREEKKIVLQCQ